MRISVEGNCESVLALRRSLEKEGYLAADYSTAADDPYLTLKLDEHDGDIIIDGIDCPLERTAINMITELTQTPVRLARVGGIRSDSQLLVTFPSTARTAVEKGLHRTVCVVTNHSGTRAAEPVLRSESATSRIASLEDRASASHLRMDGFDRSLTSLHAETSSIRPDVQRILSALEARTAALESHLRGSLWDRLSPLGDHDAKLPDPGGTPSQ